MATALLISGLLVGAVAVLAGLVVLYNWYHVVRLAPQGSAMQVALELGKLDYRALDNRLGSAAATPLASFRKAVKLFIICVGVFMVLTIINIASGTAA